MPLRLDCHAAYATRDSVYLLCSDTEFGDPFVIDVDTGAVIPRLSDVEHPAEYADLLYEEERSVIHLFLKGVARIGREIEEKIEKIAKEKLRARRSCTRCP